MNISEEKIRSIFNVTNMDDHKIKICKEIVRIYISMISPYSKQPRLSNGDLIDLFYIHQVCNGKAAYFHDYNLACQAHYLNSMCSGLNQNQSVELLDDIITEVCRIKV